MNSIIDYVKESYDELLHRVTWPTWGELIATSRVVLLATVVITLIIFLMDGVSRQVLELIYPNA